MFYWMTKRRAEVRYAGIEEAAMAAQANLFIGIRGYVLAIDRATGEDVWSTSLKGAEFVNVVLDGEQLFASSKGRLYRLDPTTGRILWENGLTGMGWGLVSIAQAGSGNLTAMEEKRRQDQAAAAGTAAATG
jgi:outer membrane protein assembly factor BamB